VNRQNPFFTLKHELAFAALGSDYYQEVNAATFPKHTLRFRNNDLIKKLGLDPKAVTTEHMIQAFGKFEPIRPFLAMSYHGYQFGEYNPQLGDGRGFLYGQFRDCKGDLYDLGTKGSGTTPYSRRGDGRLTLKGGVREVLAAEALHRLGVWTSRCLSLIETGEELWRGDEPSPTRSSVMVRMSRSHIRFGTFERLLYLNRQDLIRTLLDHVIEWYYPDLIGDPDLYARFYHSLVERTAKLAAQWMSVGFCHGVLNTDNMSIVGESFDYGPYAFIETYDPQFTAAYFDYWGYYRFGHQPDICRLNLDRLQEPLALVIPRSEMENSLRCFTSHYQKIYTERMLQKLGLDPKISNATELISLTLQFLSSSQVGYHSFFSRLTRSFLPQWQRDPALICAGGFSNLTPQANHDLLQWRAKYHDILKLLPPEEMARVIQRLRFHNPPTVLIRSAIESIWNPIALEDNWEPFYLLLDRIQEHQWDQDEGNS
jgi:uncharacterized protein YdiU (UPF0061 family)